jgi:3-hydroxyacyl-CoA dehydrogenase
MSIKKVVVAGGGVLGSQIAFQAAYCGFDVTIWLRSQGSIGRTQPKLASIKKAYLDTIAKMDTPEGKSPAIFAMGIANPDTFNADDCRKKVEAAANAIKLEIDLGKAVSDADLVIESMAEEKKSKKEFYKTLAPLLPAKTILVTNSSTMLPSAFAKFTGRPDKYLALHFANEIWKNNTAEIMGQDKTAKENYDAIVAFASDIRMVPLQLHKEKSGYILNSMLIPFLFAGLDLYATGVSDPETIDKTWVLGTGAHAGPFRIIDVIGLTTTYNIVLMYVKIPGCIAPYHFKAMAKILKQYLDAGKLGLSAGEGFYKYKK